MKITLNLDEKELETAVREYAQKRGYSKVTNISFSVDAGDRPWDSTTVSASATAEKQSK